MLTKPSKIRDLAHSLGVNVSTAGCACLEVLTEKALRDAIAKAKAGVGVVRAKTKKKVVPLLKPKHFEKGGG